VDQTFQNHIRAVSVEEHRCESKLYDSAWWDLYDRDSTCTGHAFYLLTERDTEDGTSWQYKLCLMCAGASVKSPQPFTELVSLVPLLTVE
jgi:hypothetical protein